MKQGNRAGDHPQQFTAPSLDDLQSSLQFIPEKAEIWLDSRRMVLTDNDGLGIMRQELVQALGYERARAAMTRIGYEQGAAEAELALRIRKDKTTFDAYSAGPQLHALKGAVKVEPIVFRADPEKGEFYAEYYWHNSAECETHLRHLGIDHQPGGWQQIGYASGFTTAFIGRPIVYRELKCIAMGHDTCFLVGKPAEEWENPEAELRWFRAESYTARTSSAQRSSKSRKPKVDEDLKIGKRSIVGASAGFNIVLHLIGKVAETDAPVLFLGESGVGKEVFARELHKRSTRADKPILSVNCAAIPETLVEAELFGVEKGAFTGADQTRPGRFERAGGGTLFLDEVGTLTMSAQGKLLRVLQDGDFERVGGNRELKADVRLIAATNADLRQDVREGRFREDLFHRLNVFPIRIPPLRERRADIPLLINYFLRKFAGKHGKRVTSISGDSLRYLLTYEWPGNIRELENMIERGVILAEDGHPIGLHHLVMNTDQINMVNDGTSDPFRSFLRAQARATGGPEVGNQLLDFGLSSDELLDSMIRAALDRTDGNVSEAARMVGMTRSQINYWRRKNS